MLAIITILICVIAFLISLLVYFYIPSYRAVNKSTKTVNYEGSDEIAILPFGSKPVPYFLVKENQKYQNENNGKGYASYLTPSAYNNVIYKNPFL